MDIHIELAIKLQNKQIYWIHLNYPKTPDLITSYTSEQKRNKQKHTASSTQPV